MELKSQKIVTVKYMKERGIFTESINSIVATYFR